MAENEIIVNEQEQPADETPKGKSAAEYEAEIARLTEANSKLKGANDRAASEAAEYKRKYRATQTEQEQQAAEQAERIARIEAENKAFKERERVSGYKAKLMEAGYDAATAGQMANALPEGIGDEFFAGQKSYIESVRTDERTKVLNQQPGLSPGKAPTKELVEDSFTASFRRAAGLR